MARWNKMLGRKILERWYDYTPDSWQPDTIRKAVIFTPKAVGDGMAIYPVIRALQARNLEWLCIVASHKSAPAFEALKKEGVEIQTVPRDRDYKAVKELATNLRARHGSIDLCVDATGHATSPGIYFVGKLKARMNLTYSAYNMRAFADFDQPILHETSLPDLWAKLIEKAGLGNSAGHFELPIPDNIDKAVSQWTNSLGSYVLLNLDGSVDYRSISLDKAKSLIDTVYAATGLPLVIPYAPSGEQKAMQLAREFPFVHTFPGQCSLLVSAALVKHATVVFSPDTSIIHIASAYNRPTVGVYVVIDSAWQPQATLHAVIHSTNHVEQGLTPERVAEAFKRVYPSTTEPLG
ncbi:glycosyltransferase family 9 protein [Halomonas aquamarina]|uniref:Glycosyltransferase family 9 protein n=1 Tax=Vreelandella aquamarina TaxID=77097 RepID=A0ACC5VT26_9GAMM|nr:glycosyltransferase family 9 protein [Halomonas aquamarina]MBZ5487400.1 glycosyltransferase family 9 protein [Halomonas aquamarina]